MLNRAAIVTRSNYSTTIAAAAASHSLTHPLAAAATRPAVRACLAHRTPHPLARPFSSVDCPPPDAAAVAAVAGLPAAAASPPLASVSVSYGLAGRSALVIGGCGAIGHAIARLLLQQGMRVAITSREQARASECAQRLAAALPSASSAASAAASGAAASASPPPLSPLGFHCDVTDAASVQSAVSGAFGALGHRLDLVVFAAGVNHDAIIVRAKDDVISRTVSTNLIGALHVSRAAAKLMLTQQRESSAQAATQSGAAGSSLIFIGSVVGQWGNAGQSVYAASKAGLQGLTHSLSKELSSRLIRVNCVCPGFIEGGMTRRMTEEARAKAIAAIPAARMGEADDVAHLVAFLASPQAKYITGQIIGVDGGILM